jgi:hypothetical protein
VGTIKVKNEIHRYFITAREKKNGCLNAFSRAAQTRLNWFKRIKNGQKNGRIFWALKRVYTKIFQKW